MVKMLNFFFLRAASISSRQPFSPSERDNFSNTILFPEILKGKLCLEHCSKYLKNRDECGNFNFDSISDSLMLLVLAV